MSTTATKRRPRPKTEENSMSFICLRPGFAGFQRLAVCGHGYVRLEVFVGWECVLAASGIGLLSGSASRFSRPEVSSFARLSVARLEVPASYILGQEISRVFPLRRQKPPLVVYSFP